ncbi:MAG: DUF2064 domain-containing protein [Bacteroidota bacterium]
MKERTTAILIFAQSPLEEVKCKQVSKGEALFDRLTRRTLGTVQKTGLPFYHFTEKLQQGRSFEARLSHAARMVFEKGYDNLIIIGNDSPRLGTSHLLDTLGALEMGKTVLGPSADGGFYLMGIHKSVFRSLDFKGLPWQTSQLFKTLWGHLNALTPNILRLETLFDLDNLKDVISFLSRFGTFSKTLLSYLTQIICNPLRPWYLANDLPEYGVIPIPPNKGSPRVAL